jgi:hypothetical protein
VEIRFEGASHRDPMILMGGGGNGRWLVCMVR